MNKCFIIILFVVEGSDKLFTFCMVSIFRKRVRTKFVFNSNLTGVYFTCIKTVYVYVHLKYTDQTNNAPDG